MKREEAMEVYKDRSAKFKNTQSIQWKMDLSIWTLLVLAIFYKDKMNFPACNGHCLKWTCFAEIFILAVVIIIHILYCYKTQKSLNSDKAVNTMIAEQLNKSVDPEMNVNVDLEKESNTLNWYWIVLQAIITMILAFVFFISQT